MSYTATGITVRTGPAFTGTLSVIYRIEDGTRDPARQTQGRVIVVVKDEPDAPNAPVVRRRATGPVTIRWNAPAPNNSAIDAYEVELQRRVQQFGAGAAGVNQTFTGLTNGTTYTLQGSSAQRDRLERLVEPRAPKRPTDSPGPRPG